MLSGDGGDRDEDELRELLTGLLQGVRVEMIVRIKENRYRDYCLWAAVADCLLRDNAPVRRRTSA